MNLENLGSKRKNKTVFTREMKQHLLANYAAMSVSELAGYYGLKESQVKSQMQSQQLTRRF